MDIHSKEVLEQALERVAVSMMRSCSLHSDDWFICPQLREVMSQSRYEKAIRSLSEQYDDILTHAENVGLILDNKYKILFKIHSK